MAYLVQGAKSKDKFLWCFLKTHASILMAAVLVTSWHCRMCSLPDSAARHLVWKSSAPRSKASCGAKKQLVLGKKWTMYTYVWDGGLCFNVCIYFTWNTALIDHFVKHSLQFTLTLIQNLINIFETQRISFTCQIWSTFLFARVEGNRNSHSRLEVVEPAIEHSETYLFLYLSLRGSPTSLVHLCRTKGILLLALRL